MYINAVVQILVCRKRFYDVTVKNVKFVHLNEFHIYYFSKAFFIAYMKICSYFERKMQIFEKYHTDVSINYSYLADYTF